MEAFTPPALQPANTWATKAPMTTGRWVFAGVEVNSKIYAIGGRLGFSDINTVEEYDTATDTWTNCGGTCTSMPSSRSGPAGAAINGKIYVIGGYNGSPMDTVEEFDTVTKTWTNCGGACAAMPTARGGFSSGGATLNGKVYVIGGYNGSYLDTVEEYDPATNTWTNCGGTCAAMPTARESTSIIVFNDKIYVIGGYNSASLNTVEEYDPATNTWTNCGGTCAAMPTARSYAARLAVNGNIYVIGGGDGSISYDTVEEYNPSTNTWTNCGGTCALMPTPRNGIAGVVVNGRGYIIGGNGGGTVSYQTVEEYTPPAP